MAEQWICYLSAFPNSVELLARVNRDHTSRIRLDCIFAYGQGARQNNASCLHRASGLNACELTAQRRVEKLPSMSRAKVNFHINSETVLLEVLDGQDQPCSFGTPGRIVITPIYNSAQPLFAMNRETLASSVKLCPCGRTLAVLQRILGRVEPIWNFPDGICIAPRLQRRSSGERCRHSPIRLPRFPRWRLRFATFRQVQKRKTRRCQLFDATHRGNGTVGSHRFVQTNGQPSDQQRRQDPIVHS